MVDRYYLDDLEAIYEETGKQLKSRTWSSIIGRAKGQGMRPVYLGVTKDGKILFKCSSGTTRGLWWKQEIYFKDLSYGLKMLREDPKFTNRSVVNLLQTGDLLVYCNDKSFKYWGFQYIAWKGGYGIKKEVRYPKVRNPSLRGALCKHLYLVLSVLPFYTSDIIRDFKKKGLLN